MDKVQGADVDHGTAGRLRPCALRDPGASATEMCETIRSDIATYHALNCPCPCPYSIRRNGRACGNLSAWAKPDGLAPRCYFSDVTGDRPPNKRPKPVRQAWPDPPPCTPTSSIEHTLTHPIGRQAAGDICDEEVTHPSPDSV